jgi:hypothetical protein
VFALLQQLPDEVIAYYEPVVANRYPNFIVIIPSVEAAGYKRFDTRRRLHCCMARARMSADLHFLSVTLWF